MIIAFVADTACMSIESSCRFIVACSHFGNDTGHSTVRMTAPLLLTSGPVKYEAVLHSYGDGYQLVTVRTRGGFIVLLHWNHDLLSHSVTLS